MEKTSKSSANTLIKVVIRNLWIFILLIVIGAGVGVAVGKNKVKPVYTARCSVILATTLDPSSLSSSAPTTDMSLAQIYLATVRESVLVPVTVQKANELYNGSGSISAGSIGVTGDDSCIFTISYSDTDAIKAKAKLESIILATDAVLTEKAVLSAGEANLIPVQSEYGVSVSASIHRYVILGVALGIALSVFIALLRYLLDNKIKDSDELESITETNILAFIEE